MAKLSEKYEAIIVFSLKKTEDEIKALTAKFADLIKANGTLTNIDEWGQEKARLRDQLRGRRLLCTLQLRVQA